MVSKAALCFSNNMYLNHRLLLLSAIYILTKSSLSCYGQVIGSNLGQNVFAGLSPGCQAALNTTVSCPQFLPETFMQNPRLDPDKLKQLCTIECLNDLTSAQDIIRKACSAQSEVIEVMGAQFPANWIVDRYLYSYAVSCRKDRATGQYCDTLRISWLQQDFMTDDQKCSDCILGGYEVDLNSPFGYDEEYEADFRSLTSSCNKFTYTINTPSSYLPDPTTTSKVKPVPTPSCRATHVVSPLDSCLSIALNYSVSTWSLIKLNGLSPRCNYLQPNTTLCIDSPCPVREVGYYETCNTIVAGFQGAFTASEFAAWNPNIDALCRNLHETDFPVVCVGPPGNTAIPANGTVTTTATASPVTAVPPPPNSAPNSTSNCAQWYTTTTGDTCAKISSQFSIPLSDFYFLNPQLDIACSNLWLGTAYCVKAVGSITTYPGYPSSTPGSLTRPYTLTSETFMTETWSIVIPTEPSEPVETEKPLASGTWSNCTLYKSGREKPPYVDQSVEGVNRDWPYDATQYYCNNTVSLYEVSMSDFLTWNPSLRSSGSSQDCVLSPDFRYCVLFGASQPYPVGEGLCDVITTQDIKPGTNPKCDCWRAVIGIDKGLFTCEDIIEQHEISMTDLLAWNPWIGSNCDDGIYTGLPSTDTSRINAICVRANKATTTSSSSTQISSTSASSTSSSSSQSPSAPPSPTQSGIPANCSKYHTVVNGDTCYDISKTYGITLEQFYAWNPPVGNNCAGLWIGYQYCVAAGA